MSEEEHRLNPYRRSSLPVIPKQVFCGSCRYLRTASKHEDVEVYNSQLKCIYNPDFKGLHPITGKRLYTYESPRRKNKNMDCPHYEKASIFHRIYRLLWKVLINDEEL